MATTVLTVAQASSMDSLKGVNVDPMTYFDWNIKALVPAAAAADLIETPVIDLNAVSPKCNRLVFQKLMATAAADTLKILVSADGTNWFTAPLYNGGVGGGTAVGNASGSELALVALPAFRYVKGQLTLAAAMSGQASARIGLSLMRF